MKRCPRCSEIFSAQFEFCINDGSTLIETEIGLNEYETVIRNKPFVVDFGTQDGSGQKGATWKSQAPPPQNETATERKSGYGLLLSGIGIGGFLVLATMVAMNSFGPNTVSVPTNEANKDPMVNARTENVRAENTNTTASNYNPPANAKKLEKDTTVANQEAESDLATSIPVDKTPKKALGKNYNGRVIMLNAVVRSAPSIDAPEINMVTYNEPVKIGRSAGGNNPWYRVTTASGQTGWMHGNTIEFIR